MVIPAVSPPQMVKMVDAHSHILPCVDDGSSSVEESKQLLSLLSSQGVRSVVATPHFIADDQSVEEFIEKRSLAYNALKEVLNAEIPEIFLGAEVKYYEGISRMENLKELCLENTNILLVEMPIGRWSEYAVKELVSLSCSGYRVLLAHIERYIADQRGDTFDTLLENDILTQVNASFFINILTRPKAIKLLKNGYIHLLGSDCHNLTTRPPRIGEAARIINHKMGEEFLYSMIDYSNALLRGGN